MVHVKFSKIQFDKHDDIALQRIDYELSKTGIHKSNFNDPQCSNNQIRTLIVNCD